MADTSDMAWLHQIFREATGPSIRLLAAVAPGDAARADVIGSYYDNVFRLLHGHHESEDSLMTPKLLDRLPDHAETITRIATQHEKVFAALSTAEGAVSTWRANPTKDNRDYAMRMLHVLGINLDRHLDEEEELIVPLAATCMTAAEWAELPAHGMKAFTGDKPWLITGLVQEQMPPERIALMEANMPPPVLESWTSEGRSLFDKYILELRGVPVVDAEEKKPPKIQTIAQLIGTVVALVLIVISARTSGHGGLLVLGTLILIPSLLPWMSKDTFGH